MHSATVCSLATIIYILSYASHRITFISSFQTLKHQPVSAWALSLSLGARESPWCNSYNMNPWLPLGNDLWTKEMSYQSPLLCTPNSGIGIGKRQSTISFKPRENRTHSSHKPMAIISLIRHSSLIKGQSCGIGFVLCSRWFHPLSHSFFSIKSNLCLQLSIFLTCFLPVKFEGSKDLFSFCTLSIPSQSSQYKLFCLSGSLCNFCATMFLRVLETLWSNREDLWGMPLKILRGPVCFA